MREAEWQTRRQRIDTRLRPLSLIREIVPWPAGLTPKQPTPCPVTALPTANGPANCALSVNGRLLGILEAKQVTMNPQNGLEQAKHHTRGAADGPGEGNGSWAPFLEEAHDTEANGQGHRTDTGATDRFRKIALSEVRQRGYKLDSPGSRWIPLRTATSCRSRGFPPVMRLRNGGRPGRIRVRSCPCLRRMKVRRSDKKRVNRMRIETKLIA